MPWDIQEAESIIERNGGNIKHKTVPNQDGEAKKLRIIHTPSQVGIMINGAIDYLVNHCANYLRGR